ncbi:hypothetical protein [uncultured Brevibacterium sp.]|uniref:hypothetical protein n=1 Tax=uncultured Brevibacterium sp. TaxID=189678 RepID=UPI0025F466D4|nr:hypothetical protein [uncultured Brevibacterium sp.]
MVAELRGDRLLAAQGEIDLEGPVDEGPEQLGDASADDEDDDDEGVDLQTRPGALRSARRGGLRSG